MDLLFECQHAQESLILISFADEPPFWPKGLGVRGLAQGVSYLPRLERYMFRTKVSLKRECCPCFVRSNTEVIIDSKVICFTPLLIHMSIFFL
jgi:hypothetical protein